MTTKAEQETEQMDDLSGERLKELEEGEGEREELSLTRVVGRIPQLVDQEDVVQMINLQVTAIDRLESTNKSLANCTTMAQNKLAATTRIFKKTSKQMQEAKKDLDAVYRKISELKNKIRAEHGGSSSNNIGGA